MNKIANLFYNFKGLTARLALKSIRFSDVGRGYYKCYASTDPASGGAVPVCARVCVINHAYSSMKPEPMPYSADEKLANGRAKDMAQGFPTLGFPFEHTRQAIVASYWQVYIPVYVRLLCSLWHIFYNKIKAYISDMGLPLQGSPQSGLPIYPHFPIT